MSLINGYSQKLLQEHEQEEFQLAAPRRKVFELRDFDAISEIHVTLGALLRELFADSDPQAFAENMLDNILGDKLQFTRETIYQINTELRTRKNMLFDVHEEIEQEVKGLEEYLHRLNFFDMDNKGASLLRANVRAQLTQTNKERRNHVVNAWQDLVRSRQQLRGYIEKYESLIRTRALLQV